MEKIWLLCPCMCMCRIFFAWQNFGRIDIMTEIRKFGQKTYPDILMGRYLSLRRRYQMAAFSFIVALPHVWPCCVHDEWTDDLSVCPEDVGTGAMHRWWQRYLPEAVSSSSVAGWLEYSCAFGPSSSMASGVLFLIHDGLSQYWPWDGRTSRRPSLWESRWIDDPWSKVCPINLGGRRGRRDLVSRPWQLPLWSTLWCPTFLLWSRGRLSGGFKAGLLRHGALWACLWAVSPCGDSGRA